MGIMVHLGILFSFLFYQTFDVMIVAHRGASKDAPENTLPAFELAWKQGADAIEGDFHLTKEGHIVCIHDYNTKRVSDQNLVIKESTLEELQTLDVGSWKDKKYQGTKIPTISEVFQTVPAGKKIYIEVKCGPEIIPTLIEEIEKSKLSNEQIVIISFNQEVIRELKKATMKYKANWLSSIGLDKNGKAKPSVASVFEILSDIQADGLSSSNRIINKEYVQAILSKGYEYHVWTVDDPQVAQKFVDWGALSITTNVPGVIIEELGIKK